MHYDPVEALELKPDVAGDGQQTDEAGCDHRHQANAADEVGKHHQHKADHEVRDALLAFPVHEEAEPYRADDDRAKKRVGVHVDNSSTLALGLRLVAFAPDALELDFREVILLTAEVAGHFGIVGFEDHLLQIVRSEHAKRGFGALARARTKESHIAHVENL